MAYRSLWAETNPYALEMERERAAGSGGWSGIGKLLGKGLSALAPERANEAFDPAARVSDTNVPFKKAGFFRSLAGDRSNALNSAAKIRGVDIDQSSVAAEQDEKRKKELLKEQQGFIDNRQRERLGAEARLAEIKHHDDNIKRLDSDNTWMERFRAKNLFDQQNREDWLQNRKALRGVPQALDPSTKRLNDQRAAKMEADAAGQKTMADLLKGDGTETGPRPLWSVLGDVLPPTNPFVLGDMLLNRNRQTAQPAAKSPTLNDEIEIDPNDLIGLDPALEDDDDGM